MLLPLLMSLVTLRPPYSQQDANGKTDGSGTGNYVQRPFVCESRCAMASKFQLFARGITCLTKGSRGAHPHVFQAGRRLRPNILHRLGCTDLDLLRLLLSRFLQVGG